jgi:glycosyltransferase involved in cell wall biosynthesis
VSLNINKIAFLAPEIPALSATFVYNEILELEKKGVSVLPLSVHRPSHPTREEEIKAIQDKTIYIYDQGLGRFILSFLCYFFTSPLCFIETFFMAVSDAVKVGLFNKTAAGVFYRLMAGAKVAQIMKQHKCEHLHVHFAHVPTDIAMYASAFSGIPFSFMAHANDLFERGWLLKEKVGRSKFTATISEFNKSFLVRHGAAEEKIVIIRCGIDSRTFKPRDATSITLPLKLGSLGRMVEKKGFDVLIHACSALKEKNILFNLELAGDGPLRHDLEELMVSFGLEKEITFRGSLPHNEVPIWVRGLDVFVLPCQRDGNGDMDGIPVVLMEAMLSGVPVISTKLSGIPELVEDDITGLLAEPGDPASLAQCIEKIIAETTLVPELIRNAIVKVQSEFNLGKNIDKLTRAMAAP